MITTTLSRAKYIAAKHHSDTITFGETQRMAEDFIAVVEAVHEIEDSECLDEMGRMLLADVLGVRETDNSCPTCYGSGGLTCFHA